MTKRLVIAICAVVSLISATSPRVLAQHPVDSVTNAAASILGTALRGSIGNIEQLGVKLDRHALMEELGKIVDGQEPAYSYEHAYAIIDSHVAALQNAYIDSVFSAENQQAFVDNAAKTEGAVTTPSGLVFVVLTEGEGANPASGDDVVLNYVASFSDGSVFDRTEEAVTFDVDNLVPGFTEGLKMMRPGGRYRLVIPAALAYGEAGIRGEIPPHAALDFTIDLLKVVPKPTGGQ